MQTLKHNLYRIIDVSSIDEAALRWNPKIFKKRDQIVTSMMPKNLIDYRAHSNVLRALFRLKYYQSSLFVSKK
jgi:oligoribonuclease (3'-5' exoribonuclease)